MGRIRAYRVKNGIAANALANVNGDWFLFGYCHLRRDVRTFSPTRMRSVEVTGRHFEPPAAFSIDTRLRDSFGVHSGSGAFAVIIRFTRTVADYIREKRWHESQELVELPGGAVELRLRLSSWVEVQRWILGWGGEARVIAPKELRDAVVASAKAILADAAAG